jgi:hypothetical protein
MNEPAKLAVRVKGDMRNEYIKPMHWIELGILMIDQLSILRKQRGRLSLHLQGEIQGPG